MSRSKVTRERIMVLPKGQIEVDRGKIKSDYLTPENLSIIQMYLNCREFGMPYSGGWLEQPFPLVQVLSALSNIYRKYRRN
jgi:hypothetical protein